MLALFLSIAMAQDAKPVKFTAELVSKAPYKVKFKAPAGHHFNQEAPPKVEIVGATDAPKFEKTLPEMTAEFPKSVKLASSCVLKTQLFVCDEGNTYCKPVREEFDCATLKEK